MAFDAINTTGASVFQYDNWITLLSTDSNPPDAFDVVEDPEGEEQVASNSLNGLSLGLNAVTVIQSAGGQRLDFAGLSWAVLGPLTNRTQPARFARMVEVRLPDLDNTRLHLGDYVTETERVDKDGEYLTAESHLRPYHFGTPFYGQRWWDPFLQDENVIPGQLILNPIVDGRVLPNMSDKVRTDGSSRLWIHPEAAITEAAENFSGQVAESWTLREVVLAVCEECNTAETFISNPDSTELDKLADAPVIEDVHLQHGLYLPFYLDRLLHPLNFNWKINYTTAKPSIAIFEKGVGTEKQLRFQAPGDSLNLLEADVNQYEIARRIGDSVNIVTVYGDVRRYELTIPLWPTWPEDKDALSASELNKQSGDSYEGNETVHRKWAAGEAGDYDGLRSDALASQPPQLQDIFPDDSYVEHRRSPEEPLSYMGDADNKNRRPIRLDYSTDGGTTWEELTDQIAGNLLLLPDELGVLFNSDAPPSVLIDAGTDARLRMTCTISGDKPISFTAEKTANAVNDRDVELVLNMPDKFQYRQVFIFGDYASVLNDPATGADDRDDRDALQEFAEKLRDGYEVAELDCEFRLPGWHTDYEIGDLLTNIDGREVSLDQAASGGTARYVQIVERRFENGDNGPYTVLIVDRGVREVAATT